MVFDEDIKEALITLKNGGVILYPTDTIWGLGCDATNSQAVQKIFTIKSRSLFKSMIILVDGINMIERYVMEIPEIVYELTSVSDDPLTIIYPQGKNLAPGICSEDGSVGIRICHDDFCRELIRQLRRPIVSTSANISGSISPQIYFEIDETVIIAADYIVKYRQDDSQRRTPSPIIKIEQNGIINILRK